MAHQVNERELEAIRKDEAKEQRKRIKIAGGAGLLGASCFFVPIVGGITLAVAGAAAAAALTTRDDEAGQAARASGAAVASGIERVSKLDIDTKIKEVYTTTKNRIQGPAQPEKDTSPQVSTTSWWSRTMTALRGGERPRLQVYGEARTSTDVAELIVRELADAPRDHRKRLCLEIIASLHPDRAQSSVAAHAAATSLTRVAISVKEFFEEAGFSAFDDRGIKTVIVQVRKHVDRLA